jgi:endonuclease/exonuclease/phosphatase family metal-dependent hydrolase
MRIMAEPSGSDDGDTLTVLSANLWHDWPLHRRFPERLKKFADLVKSTGADVVLLQEVARRKSLWSDEWLTEQLGMNSLYSRANGDEAAIGFEEGLAIFSRFPLGEPRQKQLGHSSGIARRIALSAKVQSPWGPFTAISVHLGLLPARNRRQWKVLHRWIGDVAGDQAFLVGGDFNAHESSRQVKHAQRVWMDAFRSLHPEAEGTTHALRWPWGSVLRRQRLDYLFLNSPALQWKVVEARHLGAQINSHSDHKAVLARIKPAP